AEDCIRDRYVTGVQTCALPILQVLVPVGDHGTTSVPTPLPDDMDRSSGERVRGTDHRTDVVVVLEVLDGYVERVPPTVDIGDDGLTSPVAIGIGHITTVTVFEQLGIVVFPGRPATLPGADAHRVLAAADPFARPCLLSHAHQR